MPGSAGVGAMRRRYWKMTLPTYVGGSGGIMWWG